MRFIVQKRIDTASLKDPVSKLVAIIKAIKLNHMWSKTWTNSRFLWTINRSRQKFLENAKGHNLMTLETHLTSLSWIVRKRHWNYLHLEACCSSFIWIRILKFFQLRSATCNSLLIVSSVTARKPKRKVILYHFIHFLTPSDRIAPSLRLQWLVN